MLKIKLSIATVRRSWAAEQKPASRYSESVKCVIGRDVPSFGTVLSTTPERASAICTTRLNDGTSLLLPQGSARRSSGVLNTAQN